MGLDLSLLPVQFEDTHGAFSHVVLPVDRLYNLFDKIKALPQRSIEAEEFNCWLGDSGYGHRDTDAYGQPLCYVLAGELAGLSDEWIEKNTNTRAAWAYLKALPWKRKVVLYWH